jgi:hypothetical protein
MPKDTDPQRPGETLADLKRHSEDLKARIEEQRRKSAMPVNSSLGNPQIDAENADGRRDLPDEEEN